MPLISVVIPTRNRTTLLSRSLNSALHQTYQNTEIIVVVDGPDQETIEFLSGISNPSLRVIALPESVLGGEARNVGVRAAKGEWIAFLDDDDEWLLEKLERQMQALLVTSAGPNFVACKWDARYQYVRKLLPVRFPDMNEDWSEYIYVQGHTIPTTCYLVRRDFMLENPFIKGLLFNQDIDWLLRVHKANLIQPIWLDEPLVIYYSDDDRPRTSKTKGWEFPLEWAEKNRLTLLSKRAFAHCILIAILPRARTEPGALSLILMLFKKAVSLGKVDMHYCLRFVVSSIFGNRLKHKFISTRNRLLTRSFISGSATTQRSKGAI